MKTFQLAFVALLVAATLTGKAFAQSEETRQVSGFHGISSGGSFTVHVKINGTESLKLQGDREDLKDIETVVEQGILRIKTPQEFRHHNFGRVEVYITAISLSSLDLGGSGSMDVSGTVKGDNVDVRVGGSGSISTQVETGDLHTGVAGSGNLQLRGTATKAKIDIAGSGSIRASDLKIDVAEISIAGSGSCHLDVEKTLSARIAGSGSVLYSGNAVTSDISTAGSGRVTRVK